MLLVHNTRFDLIQLLPKNGVVAEIGSAEGDFANDILNRTVPARLHIIDPWEHQDLDDYKGDPNNVSDEEGDRRYQYVTDRFQGQIENGVVQVHRAYSLDAAAQFEDGYFDWIYVDALHTYEGARDDLRAFYPKVKDSGFICGHDYANHPTAQEMSFGVVEAVNEFVREYDCEFVALTKEGFPTYVLAKDRTSDASHQLFGKIVMGLSVAVEVVGFEKKIFQQKAFGYSKGPDQGTGVVFSIE
jgi:hypothetical protein